MPKCRCPAVPGLDRPEREEEEHPRVVIDALGLQSGEVVADLGAGSGFFTFRIAPKVGKSGKVLAVDIQPEMLDLIRQKMKSRKMTNIEPIKGTETDYALRFHLHPSVKASRLSDGRGVMLVLPNRDVWTFEALDDKVELEDSVFLAGNDGPRRTAQIVIRQDSRHAPSIRWSFARSSASAPATNSRRNAQREPELPL